MLRLRDISLKYKILMFFLIIIIPAMGTIAYFSYSTSIAVIDRDMNNYSLQTLREVKQNIEYIMNDVENISRFILYDKQVQQLMALPEDQITDEHTRPVNDTIYNLASQKDYIYAILLSSDKGYSFSYGAVRSILSDKDSVKKEPWYQDAMRQEGMFKWYSVRYKLDYQEGVVSHLALIRAINDKTTIKPVGSVGIFLKEDYFNRYFQRIQLGQSGYFFVLDDKRQPVLNSLDGNHPTSGVIQAVFSLEGNNGYEVVEINGRKQAVIYESFNNVPWKIVGIVPYSELNQDALHVRNIIAQITLISVFCAILASFFISRGVTGSILTLIEMMRKTQMGNFTIEIQQDRKDEIGVLMGTFAASWRAGA
jgi:sensor histidine kinase YesM